VVAVVSATDHSFPVDDATLHLLIAACQVNPDTGRTHLLDFLAMGERVKSVTDLSDEFEEGGAPIYFVEHEPGYEPFGPHDALVALAEEILRLRHGKDQHG
jgi:hypothetical protein